ncbi:MAG: YcgN family cysteine cluster protein [Thioalkalispiraceae bacterium]|jgi:uncharacterized cysteine cluster protein YcgN (CxxCxxCC family)
MADKAGPRFWEDKSLAQLNQAEWEALCDGCGQCCRVKIEDEDTGELFVTNVACSLLNAETCECRDYQRRSKVPDCLLLAPQQLELFRYLPKTCAYRCMAEGRPLPEWHPLLSGNDEAVHLAGVSVRGRVVSEEYIHPDQLPEHIQEKIE